MEAHFENYAQEGNVFLRKWQQSWEHQMIWNMPSE